MSRETDSSSSGPQGRGGAAYPSGTPPYGSRQYPSLHPSQDAPEGAPEPADPSQSEEPRTETTLTTRIRINIPGSRPIPPVVMRTPVGDADSADAERTGSIPRPGSPTTDRAPAGSDSAPAAEARTESAAAEPATEKPAKEKGSSDWFAPRKPPTSTSVAGGGTAGGAEGIRGATPTAPTPPRADLPYFSDGPQRTGEPGAPRPDDFGGPASGGPRPTPNLGVRTPGPSGPTTGPVTGTSSLTPNLGVPGSGPMGVGPSGAGSGPSGVGGPARPQGPGTPGGTPRMSDDTAVLTPQFAGPAPSGPGGNVSGDTLTSGIPVVPSENRPASLFPGTPPGGRPDPASRVPGDPMGSGPAGPGGPAAASAPRPEPASASAPAPAKKQGRSKLVLLGVGVVGLLGVAYGAGLLMNHSDVPKGTTVLGVDIGGGTKEEGVTKLDAALGKRAVAPLQLSVDGKKTQLAPDKAGLSLDSQETVRSAAGSDYNPVSVIGSLFGSKRAVDPVIPVDEEKLGVALTDLAGASGSADDGTIKFEPGKAVAVPGKSGKALDVNQSMTSVRDAYRAQVQTGRTKVVQLPVTTREPTIGQAELDRAMKEFAKPAMSGLVTIKAGTKQIQFGPARSLPQILSMVPVKGRLVEHYDKKAIDTLCDGVFDGIMITKGDGKKHQLSADDVAHAMQTALLGKTPAERTATISLTGNG
ncbi:peptidoglycan binding domain-containing protein [Streptomyces gelaticus]